MPPAIAAVLGGRDISPLPLMAALPAVETRLNFS